MIKLRLSIKLLIITILVFKRISAKEIDSKTDLLGEETYDPRYSTSNNNGDNYYDNPMNEDNPPILPPTSATSLFQRNNQLYDYKYNADKVILWPPKRNDLPQIISIQVKCEKNVMKVKINFDKPFFGIIFSKGHYSDPKCLHYAPNGGSKEVTFQNILGVCGMISSENNKLSEQSMSYKPWLYTESTVVIQHDPLVQEIWDEARKLRCTWYDFYEKAVSFKSLEVDMMDAVTTNFLGDNIQCWMQIQAGKGPYSNEISGIVKIGQTLTMVLAIKDEDNKFDMIVRNCIAHDGVHKPIKLVDEYGCILRPSIMSPFYKMKNFGRSASTAVYAYFQAFKFPDSVNVHFQCIIQVCREQCPVLSCKDEHLSSSLFNNQNFENTKNEENDDDEDNDDLEGSSKHTDLLSSSSLSSTPLFNKIYREPLNSNYTHRKILAKFNAAPRSINIDKEYDENIDDFDNDYTNNNHSYKRKRSINETIANTFNYTTTNVTTYKIIKVVSPGDMSFEWNNHDLPIYDNHDDKYHHSYHNNNENDVYDNSTEKLLPPSFSPLSLSSASTLLFTSTLSSPLESSASLSSSSSIDKYCLSRILFTFGLILIISLLLVSTLIIIFFHRRIITINRKLSKFNYNDYGLCYSNNINNINGIFGDSSKSMKKTDLPILTRIQFNQLSEDNC